MTSPATAGIALECYAADGASVTATLGYDAATGTPSGLTVVNTSKRASTITLTVNGAIRTVAVPAGTKNYTPAQIAAIGLTNVTTQLGSVSAVSP